MRRRDTAPRRTAVDALHAVELKAVVTEPNSTLGEVLEMKKLNRFILLEIQTKNH
jgi:hypothetical protein